MTHINVNIFVADVGQSEIQEGLGGGQYLVCADIWLVGRMTSLRA